MQKDVANSSMDKQHAFDIRNMRTRNSNTNTITALVNELGNIKAVDSEGNPTVIRGTVVGFTTLNNQAILFTHEEEGKSYIDVRDSVSPAAPLIPSNTEVIHTLNRSVEPDDTEDHDYPDLLCAFKVGIETEPTEELHEGSVHLGQITSNGQVTINVAITHFYNADRLTADVDTQNVPVTIEGGDRVSLKRDDVTYPHLVLRADDINDVNNGTPYQFSIVLNVEQTLEEQVIDQCVTISADTEHILLSPVEINARFIVPMGEVDDVDVEPIPVDPFTANDVICDYEEELSTKTCDHIYIVTTSEDDGDTNVNVFEYFRGWLNFSADHPIESTVYFENEEIQKVYWVDGLNPLRYANIADKNGTTFWSDNLKFDSTPLLHLQEEVEIERHDLGGLFPACTVQWAFTYLDRYGAESNIAWISDIHYSSPDDRGGKPGEMCSNCFTIYITKYEPNGRFDYIRLYHILRTTLDGAVEVRRVADLAVPEPVNGYYAPIAVTDSNTTGETVDPNEFMYLGGVSIIPNTIEQKSNTLFLGNLTQSFDQLRDVVDKMSCNSKPSWGTDTVSYELKQVVEEKHNDIPADVRSGYYSHVNQLVYSSWAITSFRRGEKYRFGFQAQDKTGRWSDVWWLGDTTNETVYPKFDNGNLRTVGASYTLDKAFVDKLRDAGYRKVRPVVVYPEPWERNIFTEGLLNPTVYNVKDRSSNAPYAQSSWFLRPFPPINLNGFTWSDDDSENPPSNVTLDRDGNLVDGNYRYPFSENKAFIDFFTMTGTWHWLGFLSIDSFSEYDFSNFGSVAEYRHNYPLGDSQQRNGEIQSLYNPRPDFNTEASGTDYYNIGAYKYQFPYVLAGNNYDKNCADFVNGFADFFYVDQSILTMNSADLEFDEVLQATKVEGYSFRVSGIIPISSFISSYDILTNTPPNKYYSEENDSLSIPPGLYNSENIGATMGNDTGHGYRSFINGAVWLDDFSWHSVNEVGDKKIIDGDKYENKDNLPIGFAVYPWQGTGSLNNDNVGSRKTYPSVDENHDINDKESKSATGDNYISAELKTKTLANLHYSYRTYPISDITKSNPIPAVACTVLDEQQMALTKIDNLSDAGTVFKSLNYFGSVDKLVTPVAEVLRVDVSESNEPDWRQYPMTRKGGYPIMASYLPLYLTRDYPYRVNHLAFSSAYTPIGTFNTLTGDALLGAKPKKMKSGADRKTSSIPIKYKSCNHIVVALDYFGHRQRVFDWHGYKTENHTFEFEATPSNPTEAPFWRADSLVGTATVKLFDCDGIAGFNSVFDGVEIPSTSGEHYSNFYQMLFDGVPQGFLYMGQLYRANEFENKFGGTSDEAVEQNAWLPAGEAVFLSKGEDATLVWQAGDTYYQRYDALRTYPYTEEDVNKVVDIVSFMTETHTNIDGRYDRNRGLTNNNYCRPTNFNLLNPVYSQKDNFFAYHSINPKKVHLDTFNYSFTWSLTKTAGSLRDEWTRVTLATAYDCDGNKGTLNRIVRLDNNLVAFQDGGVAQILFNENVQIQGSDGVPIELANSGKMQGLRYYTTESGCQNKWSIAVFPNGIYWIDGRMKEFHCLGGEGIRQISTTKMMSVWFRNRKDLNTPWNPGTWNGFISHSDVTTGELLLTSADTCLCFDTATGEFTSFYDYQRTDAMFTIDGHVITAGKSRSVHVPQGFVLNDNLWLHRVDKTHSCRFYNEACPFWIEIVCNSNNEGSDYGLSKVFDNLNWRTDAWEYKDSDWKYKPFITFTELSGKDDYQRFRVSFDRTLGKEQTSDPAMPLNLRKKFKVWYTTIPRALDDNNVETLDRIRDAWCHITLKADTSVSKYRHVLHDIVVSYFIP